MLQLLNHIKRYIPGMATQSSENTIHNNTNQPRWAGLLAMWILNKQPVEEAVSDGMPWLVRDLQNIVVDYLEDNRKPLAACSIRDVTVFGKLVFPEGMSLSLPYDIDRHIRETVQFFPSREKVIKEAEAKNQQATNKRLETNEPYPCIFFPMSKEIIPSKHPKLEETDSNDKTDSEGIDLNEDIAKQTQMNLRDLDLDEQNGKQADVQEANQPIPFTMENLGRLFNDKVALLNIQTDQKTDKLFDYINSSVREELWKKPYTQYCWVLLTSEPIEGSGGKTLAQHEEMLKGNGEMPFALEVIFGGALAFAKTGKRIYSRDSAVCDIRCRDTIQNDNKWRAIVGGFAPAGFNVNGNSDYSYALGVVLGRKFFLGH